MADNFLDFEVLAEDNIRTLKVPQPTFKKPLAVVLVGIPASGKSTLTRKLGEKFPLTVFGEEDLTSFLAPRATMLSRDSVEVFQLATRTVEHLIKKGKPNIYDANIKTREQRELIKKIVEDSGGSFLLIYLNCPKETCYQRLQKHNLEVTRGEAKGFILDKDLFEYETFSTSPPAPDEPNVTYNCNNSESVFQIYSLVEKRLSEGKS
ncbi:MAG: hypothetical protein A2Z11_03905 [Candidatus Woykebacteria bacterium RBG_16_43_9]|uniref:UDP-N-acetylglucosamine kinase n=1 Tax=Candidatus Woykebacteria bacterium RBG_16_43_9 TaxID=1802596 RepID=A0A1G1WCW8_9BACT|nr:MAG: hypothetical protein A2Z11_03905 [Candidatus Woykebacteria bacterium RBG_16_43_9]